MEARRPSVEVAPKFEQREGERTSLPRIVALMVENQRGELLCQRRAGERHHGAWTVTAGGHQRNEEDDGTTLVRETIEEIGIRPPEHAARGLELHFPGSKDARASWIQCYTATVEDPVLGLELDPQEVSEITWIHPEELLDPQTYLQPEFRHILQVREELKRAPFAVIWDMDDTIFASKPHLDVLFAETIYRMTGRRATKAQLDMQWGHHIYKYVELLNESLGCTLDAAEFTACANAIEEELHEHAGILPHGGVPELIHSLRAQGVPHAIGTASQAPRARRILDQLDIRASFYALVGREDVLRHKPDPEVFLTAAARLGVAPKQCIVFEDSPHGLRAAKSAGMIPIAFDCYDDELARQQILELAHHVTRNYEELTPSHLTELIAAHQR